MEARKTLWASEVTWTKNEAGQHPLACPRLLQVSVSSGSILTGSVA
jgi:hypothetical protein